MAIVITTSPDMVSISQDEFGMFVSPAILRRELRATSIGPIVTGIRLRRTRAVPATIGKKPKPAVDSVATLLVSLSGAPTTEQQRDLADVVRRHVAASDLEQLEVNMADLPASDRARGPVYYPRAPKVGEAPGAGTGTLLYVDHLGNWRRVSDDSIVRPAGG